MFHELVNHNNDLRRLVEKGYAVGFDSNCLIVRDIPYLNEQKQLQVGAIVTKLVFVDQERVVQEDHQIFFAGSAPYNLNGAPVPNLGGGAAQLMLSEACRDVVVQRSFSNKPRDTGKFEDFFEKIESYVAQISGPAIHLFGVTPYTFRIVEGIEPNSVFKVHDTLTSRAEIADLSAKFANDEVAIIGLGGTGSYVLDFFVRTPVRRIRAFDPDIFCVHNAFRSPGTLTLAELGKPKAEVYQERHNNFRNGLSIERKFIDGSSGDDFIGVTFAFVCVDKGSSRAGIFDVLLSKGIPFIDVGMGLSKKDGPLRGLLRATYYPAGRGQSVRDMHLADEADDPDDIYRTNIQIGELNALNACLAVIRFKQLRGFYFEEASFFHLLFDIGDLKIVGEVEKG
jgi:hypothetical protein